MNKTFCNVALAVPLRTTFTYAVPEHLREAVQPGVRVLVPFRQKSLVGVVVDLPERAPEKAKIREISRVLDVIPALTPKLIELGHWIAGYYLAPVGEVFRAMLPPVTELRTERRVALTDSGRQAAENEAATAVHANTRNVARPLNPEEHKFLSQLRDKGGAIPFAS